MDNRFPSLTRRSFLALPALLPFTSANFGTAAKEHHFHYDHVIGTSLDLAIWTSDADAAGRARDAVQFEIQRLSSILNTRNPDSEIAKLGDSDARPRSRALGEVLAGYDYWARKTDGVLSVRPGGPDSPRNVDALGKAYIIDRAVEAALSASPTIESVVVNIGGDIAVRGRACDIDVTNPASPYDNAEPLTRIAVRNGAVATSGSYARGAHILDPRTGQPMPGELSATVVASDATMANALATMLCVVGAEKGLPLVNATPGAEALVVGPRGAMWRSLGFSALESPRMIRTAAVAAWPPGFLLTIQFTLTQGRPDIGGSGGGGGGTERLGLRREAFYRHFVAVWIEDMQKKVVRVLAFWVSDEKYYKELSSFTSKVSKNKKTAYALARATRNPGRYGLVWDGLDDQKNPVPPDMYRIVIETNQERGTYAKQTAMITCADSPVIGKMSETENFEKVLIAYGPLAARG